MLEGALAKANLGEEIYFGSSGITIFLFHGDRQGIAKELTISAVVNCYKTLLAGQGSAIGYNKN